VSKQKCESQKLKGFVNLKIGIKNHSIKLGGFLMYTGQIINNYTNKIYNEKIK